MLRELVTCRQMKLPTIKDQGFEHIFLIKRDVFYHELNTRIDETAHQFIAPLLDGPSPDNSDVQADVSKKSSRNYCGTQDKT